MGNVRIKYSIPFGSNIRIEYKPAGSAGPYTQYNAFPGAEDSPYTAIIPAGFYDVRISTICPTCSGNDYSDGFVTQVTVLT